MIPHWLTLGGIAVAAGLTGVGAQIILTAGIQAFKGKFGQIEWQGRFTEFGLGALGVEADISVLSLQSEPVYEKKEWQKGNGSWLFIGLGVKAELLQLSAVTGGTTMLSPSIWGLASYVFSPFYSLWASSAFVVFEGGTTAKLYAGFGESKDDVTVVQETYGFALPSAGGAGGIVIPTWPFLNIRKASGPR
jgi:hypothetical protein